MSRPALLVLLLVLLAGAPLGARALRRRRGLQQRNRAHQRRRQHLRQSTTQAGALRASTRPAAPRGSVEYVNEQLQKQRITREGFRKKLLDQARKDKVSDVGFMDALRDFVNLENSMFRDLFQKAEPAGDSKKAVDELLDLFQYYEKPKKKKKKKATKKMSEPEPNMADSIDEEDDGALAGDSALAGDGAPDLIDEEDDGDFDYEVYPVWDDEEDALESATPDSERLGREALPTVRINGAHLCGGVTPPRLASERTAEEKNQLELEREYQCNRFCTGDDDDAREGQTKHAHLPPGGVTAELPAELPKLPAGHICKSEVIDGRRAEDGEKGAATVLYHPQALFKFHRDECCFKSRGSRVRDLKYALTRLGEITDVGLSAMELERRERRDQKIKELDTVKAAGTITTAEERAWAAFEVDPVFDKAMETVKGWSDSAAISRNTPENSDELGGGISPGLRVGDIFLGMSQYLETFSSVEDLQEIRAYEFFTRSPESKEKGCTSAGYWRSKPGIEPFAAAMLVEMVRAVETAWGQCIAATNWGSVSMNHAGTAIRANDAKMELKQGALRSRQYKMWIGTENLQTLAKISGHLRKQKSKMIMEEDLVKNKPFCTLGEQGKKIDDGLKFTYVCGSETGELTGKSGKDLTGPFGDTRLIVFQQLQQMFDRMQHACVLADSSSVEDEDPRSKQALLFNVGRIKTRAALETLYKSFSNRLDALTQMLNLNQMRVDKDTNRQKAALRAVGTGLAVVGGVTVTAAGFGAGAGFAPAIGVALNKGANFAASKISPNTHELEKRFDLLSATEMMLDSFVDDQGRPVQESPAKLLERFREVAALLNGIRVCDDDKGEKNNQLVADYGHFTRPESKRFEGEKVAIGSEMWDLPFVIRYAVERAGQIETKWSELGETRISSATVAARRLAHANDIGQGIWGTPGALVKENNKLDHDTLGISGHDFFGPT